MSLETVLIILFISPFAIGVLSVFFTGNHAATPIIVDYRPSQSVQASNGKEAEHESEFLDELIPESEAQTTVDVTSQELESRLEDSPDALEILQEIPADDNLAVKTSDYEVSGIPEELNKSLNDLFNAIDGQQDNSGPQVAAAVESESTDIIESPLYLDVPDEFGAPAANYTEFENSTESIDEMLEHIQGEVEQSGAIIYNFPFGESLPINPREYMALQNKYGADVISRITTTPGRGGTGDYDCMIGRVVKKYDLTILQYGDHFIPLKGLDDKEGVFLVEGMFVRPDLFYVNNFEELMEQTTSIGKVAGK